MSEWSDRFANSRWTKAHPNGVVTHGSTEPIMTVLELRGFELRDMFLIGFNDNCGSIVLPTEQRAEEAKAALEPAYQVEVGYMGREGCWEARYDRRHMDGTVPSWFITDITLKDGTKVMENGRWIR
jgi:hypothetical protein